MVCRIRKNLEDLRADYAKATGSPFQHFYCPMSMRDEQVELCEGHVLNQKLEHETEWLLPQRKDIDGWFGSVAEADFLTLLRAKGKTLADVFFTSGFRRQLKPTILAAGQEIEGKRLVEPIPGGFTAAAKYEVNYTYANGVQHRCLSTTANNIFGDVQRPPKAAELLTGVKFEGSEGWIYVTRGKIEASRPELLSQPFSSKKVELYVSNDHMKNFFDCVRSRKAPICDAEIGHRYVSVCHLGVIALRLGRKLRWDPESEGFVDDKEAESYLSREMRKPWTYEAI